MNELRCREPIRLQRLGRLRPSSDLLDGPSIDDGTACEIGTFPAFVRRDPRAQARTMRLTC
jgi:hypothetical protein